MLLNNFFKQINPRGLMNIFLLSSALSLNILTVISYFAEHKYFFVLLCIICLLNGLLASRFLNLKLNITLIFTSLIFVALLTIHTYFLLVPKFQTLDLLLPTSLFFFPIIGKLIYYKSKLEIKEQDKLSDNKIIDYVLYSTIGAVTLFLFYRSGTYSFQGDEYYFVREMHHFFNEGGQLFYMGEGEPYGRSKLTSLLLIAWIKFLNLSNLDLIFGQEFIFRSLFTTLHVFCAYMIFRISRLYTDKTASLFISAIFLSEVWFIYLGTYIRFYVPTLSLILLLLFVVQRYKSKIVTLSAIGTSLISNFFVQAYFLFIGVFFGSIFIFKLIKEKRYVLTTILGAMGVLSLGFLYVYLLSSSDDAHYNSLTYSFSLDNIILQSKWLFQNYFIYATVFTGSIFWVIKNSLKNIHIYTYVWASFIFYFLYVNHVPFNFTFRPFYFFLPVLIICSLLLMQQIFPKKFALYAYTFLLSLNIISLALYPAHKSGEAYFPTKLTFEKHAIIYDNQSVVEFINMYTSSNPSELQNVISLAYPEKMYLGTNFDIIQNFSWNRGAIDDFKEYMNSDGTIVIVHANAYCNVTNKLYSVYYNRSCVTEVSSSFVSILNNNTTFQRKYLSDDKLTAVYANF